MAETPNCCDSPLDILRKILLQLLSMANNPPESLFPAAGDSRFDIYKKILLTLGSI